jgi:type I restriction enzyme S subunit
MKNGWQTKTIEEVCQFSNGLWKGEKPPFVNVGVIRNTNFTKEGTLDDSDIAYLDVEAKKLETRRLQFGDIILEKSGGGPKQAVGRVALFDKQEGDFSFSNFTAALRVGKPRELDFRFLHKFLHWTYVSGITKSMQSHSTGIRNLDGGAYKSIKVSFPSLPEQQRIVGILDEAFQGIATVKAHAEKNLQSANDLFESYLQSVFANRGKEWKRVRIDEACESIMDCVNKTAPKVDRPTPFKMIRTTNVRNGRVNLETVNYVTEEVYRIWTRRQIPKWGDVLLTREAPMGEVGMIMSDDKVFLGQRIVSYRPNAAKLNNRFLLYALQSRALQEQIHALASGSTVQHMRVPDSKNLELLLPSLAEQMTTVETLDQLREETQRLGRIYECKLDALEELKKSLLDKAFSGELTTEPRKSVVIPFPRTIPNITTTDLHAGILAIAYQLHERQAKQGYFGHVKAEKVSHMVEAHLGIDLGRHPVKDAAGPDDYPHLKRVEHRAKNAGFFLFRRTEGSGYKLAKCRRFDFLIRKTRLALGDRNPEIDALLNLMLPMDTDQSEILATVYAAWNNLLIERHSITDEAIVLEARENWHPDKLNIERDRFFKAIKWMKKQGVIPTGKGNKVVSSAKKKNAKRSRNQSRTH